MIDFGAIKKKQNKKKFAANLMCKDYNQRQWRIYIFNKKENVSSQAQYCFLISNLLFEKRPKKFTLQSYTFYKAEKIALQDYRWESLILLADKIWDNYFEITSLNFAPEKALRDNIPLSKFFLVSKDYCSRL